MRCPNCGKEEVEGATECHWCSVIFAKWKNSSQPPLQVAPENSSTSSRPLLIGLGLLLIIAVRWVYQRTSSHSPKSPSGSAPIQTAAPEHSRFNMASELAKAEKQEELPPPSEFPTPIENPCWIEGMVQDFYRLTPISGLALAFRGGGREYAATTNFGGMYRVELQGDKNFYFEVNTPDYSPHYIHTTRRDLSDLSWEHRVNRGKCASPAFVGADFTCKLGQTATADFFLIPTNLTDEEKEKVDKFQCAW